jgi:hypothetical protein
MAIVFLDSGIIGLVTNPRKQGQALACEQWMLSLLARGVNVVSSEICDFYCKWMRISFNQLPIE